MKLFLFNNFHNGDIFASKEFVRQIIDSYDWTEVRYFHGNSPKLLNDLNVIPDSIFTGDPNMGDRNRACVIGDTMYINTWIGNYLHDDCGINWVSYSEMFYSIFNWIGSALDTSINLRDYEDYIPTIDFSKYDVNGIVVPENSILISNGPSLSGQSKTEGFERLIEKIIETTNNNVILTHPSSVVSDRIFYTSNMITTYAGDLNEISFVAERCSAIVGRNSGPFCYAHTKSILNDENKLFVAVGTNKKDCFPHGVKINCGYEFIYDTDGLPKDNEVLEALAEYDKI